MWIKIEDWLTPMAYSRYIGKSMSWVTKLLQTKQVDAIEFSGGRLIHKSGKFPKDSNPIKDNRIVSDKTFAVRFRDFMENVETVDIMGEEEKEYLLSVAKRLLKHQIKTVTEYEEIEYLKRIKLMK